MSRILVLCLWSFYGHPMYYVIKLLTYCSAHVWYLKLSFFACVLFIWSFINASNLCRGLIGLLWHSNQYWLFIANTGSVCSITFNTEVLQRCYYEKKEENVLILQFVGYCRRNYSQRTGAWWWFSCTHVPLPPVWPNICISLQSNWRLPSKPSHTPSEWNT